MPYGAAGYAIVRFDRVGSKAGLARITNVRQSAKGFANYQDWINNTQLEQSVSLEDYSVSNRGLRAGLVGTPEQVAERILEFEVWESTCCCSSSARSRRKWKGLRSRSFL